MVRFVHARLHGHRLRALTHGDPLVGDLLLRLVVVICPRCDVEYFADVEPSEDPTELELPMGAALTRLEGECPDHAHRFVVDG